MKRPVSSWGLAVLDIRLYSGNPPVRFIFRIGGVSNRMVELRSTDILADVRRGESDRSVSA